MTAVRPVGAAVYVAGATLATVVESYEDGAIVREHDDHSEGWHPWSSLTDRPAGKIAETVVPASALRIGDRIRYASGREVTVALVAPWPNTVRVTHEDGSWHIYRRSDRVHVVGARRCAVLGCGRRLSTLPGASGDYCAEHDDA